MCVFDDDFFVVIVFSSINTTRTRTKDVSPGERSGEKILREREREREREHVIKNNVLTYCTSFGDEK